MIHTDLNRYRPKSPIYRHPPIENLLAHSILNDAAKTKRIIRLSPLGVKSDYRIISVRELTRINGNTTSFFNYSYGG
uniref:Uncharacterized protein n=1 Tax=Romanomermis culicivorax TaxID=13658 RepID=A0A915HY63_ROMCU